MLTFHLKLNIVSSKLKQGPPVYSSMIRDLLLSVLTVLPSTYYSPRPTPRQSLKQPISLLRDHRTSLIYILVFGIIQPATLGILYFLWALASHFLILPQKCHFKRTQLELPWLPALRASLYQVIFLMKEIRISQKSKTAQLKATAHF